MNKEPRELRPAEVELRKLLPNMITAASLCAGLASIHYSLKLDYKSAILAVMIAFILDGLDGRMARLLRVTSKFGESFDSMADFTAFGVAPAFLLYQWQLGAVQIVEGASTAKGAMQSLGPAVCMLFALCSAIRLARFTANAGKVKKPGAATGKFFAGLPAPAAGGAVLIPPMIDLSPTLNLGRIPPELTIGLTAILAVFMVSKIPMMSVKGIKVSRKLVSSMLALVGLMVFGVMADGWLTASAFFALYLLTFPLGTIMYRRAAKKEASEALLHSSTAER